jgi:segregation and condensation protein A
MSDTTVENSDQENQPQQPVEPAAAETETSATESASSAESAETSPDNAAPADASTPAVGEAETPAAAPIPAETPAHDAGTELPDSAEHAQAELRVKLPVFEGPLDLLLYLIKKDELDIYDIPIENIARQYLDYLQFMKLLDLEVAGEFLVVASTLLYIKSRTLLPKDLQPPEEDAEEDDPRWDLIRQLVEYKKFKDAAWQLHLKQMEQGKTYQRGTDELPPERSEERAAGEVGIFDLINAFQKVLNRVNSREDLKEIFEERFTVSDKINTIRQLMEGKERIFFVDLFVDIASRTEIIVTFLALLELIRMKFLCVLQSEPFGEIEIGHNKNSAPLFGQPITITSVAGEGDWQQHGNEFALSTPAASESASGSASETAIDAEGEAPSEETPESEDSAQTEETPDESDVASESVESIEPSDEVVETTPSESDETTDSGEVENLAQTEVEVTEPAVESVAESPVESETAPVLEIAPEPEPESESVAELAEPESQPETADEPVAEEKTEPTVEPSAQDEEAALPTPVETEPVDETVASEENVGEPILSDSEQQEPDPADGMHGGESPDSAPPEPSPEEKPQQE